MANNPKVTSHLNQCQTQDEPGTSHIRRSADYPSRKRKKILEQGQRNPRAAGARIRLGNLLRI